MAEEHEASKALTTLREKPLNQTQVKNLKEIVEGDFWDLNDSISTDIENRASRKIEEVNERYKDVADLEQAQEQLQKMKREMEDRFREFVNQVTNGKNSISLKKGRHAHSEPFNVEVFPNYLVQEGLDEEIEKIRNAKNRLNSVLHTVIQRELRSIHRTILLQSLSGAAAMEIINDQPNAQDLMALVAAELAKNNQDDLELLMTEEEIKQSKAIKKESE